ncbi:MAG: cupin domain-containing protein [Owenweeksia sp.]
MSVIFKDHLYWVEKLQLQPHPEGGFYKETYRSTETIDTSALPERFGGNRTFGTAIYFMLTAENFSAFHRIQSDETWHFYTGQGLKVSMIHPNGIYEEIQLGAQPERGQVFQATVPAGVWFGSKLIKPEGWCLVGCTVAPGFDFADFEMADRAELIREFPQHQQKIEQLTR